MTDELQGRRILVVDDEPAILNLLADVFSRTEVRMHTAGDGREALRQVYAHKPDLVILDLMLPEMDGWQVCRRIREISDVPIIMLTALCDDREIIRGLESGADDYVVKPFSPNVLLARARAALRRATYAPNGYASVTFSDGHLTIDLDKRQVLVREEPVKLSATEYRLLAYLVQHAGRVLTFEQILDHVWEEADTCRIEYVHVYVSRLRQKLEPDAACPRYFVSERGVGYRFEKQTPGTNGNG